MKAYRKANEIRQKRTNEEAWLQGAYIYHALCCVSPVLHAFAKSGAKPEPYMPQPISITSDEIKRKQEQRMRANAEAFGAFVKMKNAEFRKKKEVSGHEH